MTERPVACSVQANGQSRRGRRRPGPTRPLTVSPRTCNGPGGFASASSVSNVRSGRATARGDSPVTGPDAADATGAGGPDGDAGGRGEEAATTEATHRSLPDRPHRVQAGVSDVEGPRSGDGDARGRAQVRQHPPRAVAGTGGTGHGHRAGRRVEVSAFMARPNHVPSDVRDDPHGMHEAVGDNERAARAEGEAPRVVDLGVDARGGEPVGQIRAVAARPADHDADVAGADGGAVEGAALRRGQQHGLVALSATSRSPRGSTATRDRVAELRAAAAAHPGRSYRKRRCRRRCRDARRTRPGRGAGRRPPRRPAPGSSRCPR